VNKLNGEKKPTFPRTGNWGTAKKSGPSQCEGPWEYPDNSKRASSHSLRKEKESNLREQGSEGQQLPFYGTRKERGKFNIKSSSHRTGSSMERYKRSKIHTGKEETKMNLGRKGKGLTS